MTDQRSASITIRAARPAEYPRVALLTVAAYRSDQQVRPGHPYERVLADVAGRAASGELLVAEEVGTGRVVGSVLFLRPGSRFAEVCRPGEAEFRTLAVDPAAQGRGVGAALVQACLDRASAAGFRAVVICTRDFATTAHRLYASFGFVRTPERDFTPKRGVNLWTLRRELPPSGEVG